MRMLSDGEIADRLYGLVAALPAGEPASTSALFRKIKISPEELLPVGSLLGIHNLLMERIARKGEFAVEFLSAGPTPMPQHAKFVRK